MNVYVAYLSEDGKIGWVLNPKPYFDGRCFMSFSRTGVTAGVISDIFKPGMELREFKKVLEDELDRLGVPWASSSKPRFAVKMLGRKMYEVYYMDVKLTGPLPVGMALHVEGVRRKKPVKVMVRYGG